MKSNYLPKDLPFLPGNSYADPTIQNYHKNQLLSVGSVAGSANTICGKLPHLKFEPTKLASPFLMQFYNLFF
jgi:hypothetical protein